MLFSRGRLIAAAAAAVAAGLLYHATLLPGFDFGDTASFQVMAGSPAITPRDGYPLYFALGDLVLWLTGSTPAHALNLASALEAAVACGLTVLVASELAGSTVAGLATAALFATSYTFWSQAIIAEVYALHIAMMALTLLLLLCWAARPTTARLALFFAAYALGFGNHLSMILLAPGYTLFLFLAARHGWRDVLNTRVIVLAVAVACAGALQYLWNIRSLWLAPLPPASLADAANHFWFDVTKVDWRESTMANVPISMTAERLRMYGFDVLQQFGWPGAAISAIGAGFLWATSPARAALLSLVYVVNLLFALTYNVGDTHVFLLPSHFALVLFASCGIGACQRAAAAAVGVRWRTIVPCAVAALFGVYAGTRVYRDFPALDRSGDTRPSDVLAALGDGLDDRRDVLAEHLNWQIENGLTYFAKNVRPDIAWTSLTDVAPYLPTFIRDNATISRRIVIPGRDRAWLGGTEASAGVEAAADPAPPDLTLAGLTHDIPVGTPYVLCVLKPTREFTLDASDVAAALAQLTGNRTSPDRLLADDYAALAGVVGSAPVWVQSSNHPFRAAFSIRGIPVVVRMESWLAFDTIRRMGFGQVVARRHHTLIAERGVSFAAFDGRGRPIRTGYIANIFARQQRYTLRAGTG